LYQPRIIDDDDDDDEAGVVAVDTEVLGEILPQCRFVQHRADLGSKTAINYLSYGTTCVCDLILIRYLEITGKILVYRRMGIVTVDKEIRTHL
jgi:hypothetical protein